MGITKDYDHFTFLNEVNQLSLVGWDNPSQSKLWRYNLHYFDYLNQIDLENKEVERQNNNISKWNEARSNKNGAISYGISKTSISICYKSLCKRSTQRKFRSGFRGFSKLRTALDKGLKNQFHKLNEQTKSGGSPLILFEELINTTKASFAAIGSLQKGKWIIV